MEVTFGQSLSIEFKQTTKNEEIRELSDKLESFFKPRNYGLSIESYIIGVISVHPNFDPFFTIMKPKYFDDTIEIHDGIEAHIYKSFEFNIKLDFQPFLNSTKEEGLKMVASEIMKALSSIKYPKKVTDFNGTAFHRDFECFFRDLNLIK
ncbi:MAG: hypothetical protein FWF46_09610 [Oscillospiraceae bacterium]|nr:hypothetical protein [Oscillospiraceae bacterium]